MRRSALSLHVLLLGALCTGLLVVPAQMSATLAGPGRDNVAEGYGGGVSSPDADATQAGSAALASGGNATDAALAAAAVLAVTEPDAAGLGGGAVLLRYDPAGGTVERIERCEPLGAATAWQAAARAWGTVPLAAALEPARALAKGQLAGALDAVAAQGPAALRSGALGSAVRRTAADAGIALPPAAAALPRAAGARLYAGLDVYGGAAGTLARLPAGPGSSPSAEAVVRRVLTATPDGAEGPDDDAVVGVVAADRWGGVTAVALTLGARGGAAPVSGAGFALGAATTGGCGTATPTIVTHRADPMAASGELPATGQTAYLAAVGTGGTGRPGKGATAGVAAVVCGRVERGLPLDEALEAPRGARVGSGAVVVEAGLGADAARGLGRLVASADGPEAAALVALELKDDGRVQAVAERRRGGGGSAAVVHPDEG
ncbi:gamma-glutamyltransferase [Motilibacter aurantiacus]|uniref:gamma-glutamyltransferase n=1 Tax=Motilibacter aurantiacus TaxID=2714955 RepID=UPI00140E2B94|nr:gamma-glutamyltransferase [Motilibacter aurantiacus]NHC44540.1 hypothetical protein [Motilibacter aurantiacus]